MLTNVAQMSCILIGSLSSMLYVCLVRSFVQIIADIAEKVLCLMYVSLLLYRGMYVCV